MNLKSKIQELKKKIPNSISELNYTDNDLFKSIFGFLIGYLLGNAYFLAAASFAMVYVFRYFYNPKQRIFHYAFAAGGFILLALKARVYWPLLLGLALYGLNKYKKTDKQIFWFEMGAGIPYLFII